MDSGGIVVYCCCCLCCNIICIQIILFAQRLQSTLNIGSCSQMLEITSQHLAKFADTRIVLPLTFLM